MKKSLALGLAVALIAGIAHAEKLTDGLKQGQVKLTSVGPLAFGPDGVLFISDPMAATIYAVDTGDAQGKPDAVKLNIKDLGGKLAAMLGAERANIRIQDVAVNPASGNVYLAVDRASGRGSDSLILRVTPDEKIAEVALDNIKSSHAKLPNAPESRRTRRGNARMSSITDLAFVDGRVFVAGLSNEEFASKLRAIPFPFKEAGDGTSVEIYHGAHGQFETRSPVRTFATYKINDKPHLLAAYTCTPLVKFPIDELKPGTKIKGVTIAELGNRNRPLDMFVYTRAGKDYILMANSSRGVMKITTEDIDKIQGITERVGGGGTAGLSYETIDEMKGIAQLDRLTDEKAVVLIEDKDDGRLTLKTVGLP